MRCATCHNPQTRGGCVRCGSCVAHCPQQALSLPPKEQGGPPVCDSLRCIACGQCIAKCPQSADPHAFMLSIPALMAQLERAAPFVTGITVSGGEPTCQLPFLRELFIAIKANPRLISLTTLLDTNGTLATSGWGELLPYTDGVMVDLKSFDKTRHHAMTGMALELVCASIAQLSASGKLFEVRVLLVPGFNDDARELKAMASFLHASFADVRVRLIAYHPRAPISSTLWHNPATPALIAWAREIFLASGLRHVVV